MRNTICAALTTITLALCTALAGCGGMAKASTSAHAVKPIDSQCTDGGTTHGFYECVITLQDTRKSGLCRLRMGEAGRPVLRLEPCERCRQGAGKMSYNVVTTEGVRTFENIDDAGDYAQAMSLRTGEPAKVFHAETGLVAFTVRPTTKDTK